MTVSDGTIDFIAETLSPLGRITARRMFSGAGLYCDGVIFALHLADALYLKADAATIPAFVAEGMPPFTYATKLGDRRVTSYWRAPDRLFDEPEEFVTWARRALAVSLSKPAKGTAKGRKAGAARRSKGGRS